MASEDSPILNPTPEQVEGVRTKFKKDGLCGNLTFDGAFICVRPAGHEENCEEGVDQ